MEWNTKIQRSRARLAKLSVRLQKLNDLVEGEVVAIGSDTKGDSPGS